MNEKPETEKVKNVWPWESRTGVREVEGAAEEGAWKREVRATSEGECEGQEE